MKLFKKNILSYIKEFRGCSCIYNLSEEVINNALTLHKLKEGDFEFFVFLRVEKGCS